MLSAPACVPDAIAHYEPALPRQRLPQAIQCYDSNGERQIRRTVFLFPPFGRSRTANGQRADERWSQLEKNLSSRTSPPEAGIPSSIMLDPAIWRCATPSGVRCLPASLPPMHGSALPRLPSRTLLVARRPPCLPPVTYCRVRRCPHSCTTRAAHPDDVPASSARARPPYSSRPDLELDSYFYHNSNPGLVPSASQHCWRHGVQYSAGCLVDYYLLTVFDGAWELLELSKARPRTAALPSPCISPPISPMLHMRCCPPNIALDLSGARARVGLRTAAAAPPGARPGPRRRALSQRS